jgi:hypothetical protein
MSVVTDRWRKVAAELREDAEGLPAERHDLLAAADHLDCAANDFDSSNETMMRELFGENGA